MERNLLQYFWNCGDDQIIQFALQRAHLNANERKVVTMMLDDCLTQEDIAEELNYSTRRIWSFWKSGADKLISIPWVRAYAVALKG